MAEEREFQFTNFARSTLTAAVSASTTQLRVAESTGVRFPQLDPTYDEIFSALLFFPGNDDIFEVVYATQIAGDIITVERGKEGGAARAFPAGAILVHAPTRGFFEQLQAAAPASPDAILKENFEGHILTQDGSLILLE